MFVKLTRLDGQPIWINASFLVTVEPRKQGGSTVVPIGDGLDYDVRESPEAVLALAAGAPVPTVVPVPTSDALTKTPDDVSPEPERSAPEPVREAAPAEPPRKVARPRTRKAAKKAAAVPAETVDFSDEQVERLRKMAPRSAKRLLNALSTQFKVASPESVVQQLVARGVLALEQDHVSWK